MRILGMLMLLTFIVLLISNMVMLMYKDPWIFGGGIFTIINPIDLSEHLYIYDATYDIPNDSCKRVLVHLQLFEKRGKTKVSIAVWNKSDGFVQEPLTSLDKIAWARCTYIITVKYKDYLFHNNRRKRDV